jgi:hypothetical protein
MIKIIKVFLRKSLNTLLLKLNNLIPNGLLTHSNCNETTYRCLENFYSVGFFHHLKGANSPKCCHENLEKILEETIHILDKDNHLTFLTFGTFLGARRHEGIIPWDTDIDIGTTTNASEIYKLLKTELINREVVYENENLVRVFLSKKNTLHVDVEIWKDYGDNLVFEDDLYIGKRSIDKNLVFPLRKLKFGRNTYNCPATDEWLFRVYGKNCLESYERKYEMK